MWEGCSPHLLQLAAGAAGRLREFGPHGTRALGGSKSGQLASGLVSKLRIGIEAKLTFEVLLF